MRTYTIEWQQNTEIGIIPHSDEFKRICAQDALNDWESKHGTPVDNETFLKTSGAVRILSVKVR